MKTALLILTIFASCDGYHHSHNHHHSSPGFNKKQLTKVFAWKQLSYKINGTEWNGREAASHDALSDSEKTFIQYNNVPVGFEKYHNKLFITVPRRRYGIPSTLNYVLLDSRPEPVLLPYPDSYDLVSVYRPRVDSCGRLWVVDTGLLEVPGARKQIHPPAIVIYNLKSNRRILKYELKTSDLVNERSPAGLTSITVDVDPNSCDDAHAYINDLATNGIIVFSLKKRDSWRIEHSTFVHDARALNFTVAGNVIDWKDGVFSISISEPDGFGKRRAFFHPLASTEEFSIDTEYLKTKGGFDGGQIKRLGTRGPYTQSGSHDYHSKSNVLFYANVAQDAILCFNINQELSPMTVAIAAQDHSQLVYITDLKVINDEVWVLVNQMPRFIYSSLKTNEDNFFIFKAKVEDLIQNTVCKILSF